MFEHSLIDLEVKSSPRRRWLSLPIAVGLHVVGLTAFAFASYWNVGPVQEPQLTEVFTVSLPIPPPPGGGGQKPKTPVQTVKKETVQQAPDKPVQPNANTVPEKPPAAAAVSDLVQDPSSGPVNEGPIGIGEGPGPGGPGIGPGGPGVGPGPGPGIDNAPLVFSFGMTKPEIIHQVQPRYSEMARRAALQGAVIVEAVIDELGQVTHVRLIRGLPMQLDVAAMDAIKQWRFKPALLNGRPVKVYYTLTVNFAIQR